MAGQRYQIPVATYDAVSAAFPTSAMTGREFFNRESSTHSPGAITFTVPAASPYQVRLHRVSSQSDVTVTVGGSPRSVVLGASPSAGQVGWDLASGVITFHSSDASGSASVTLSNVVDTVIAADFLHLLQKEIAAVQTEVERTYDLGTGLVAKTGTSPQAFAARSIAETGNGLTVTNGDGVSGNPTLSLEAGLEAIANLAKTDGNVIVGNGTTWVAESGATARGSLGLAGIEDILTMAQDAGAIIVGTGSGWDEQSGDTARTSLGLGSASAVSFASVSTTGAVAATGLLSGSNLPNKGNTNLVAGPSAGPSGSTGVYNVILGTSANSAGGSSGGYSVMIGFHAGRNYGADANAQQAVFIGRHAAYNATTGIASVCVGESAGYGMTTGMDNVLVGSDAGWNAADVAGAGITTGSHNTAVGNNAGYTASDASQTGDNNSAFGANSGWTGGSASYQTAVGAGAIADADNQIMLGRPAGQDEVAIPGDLDLRGTVTSDLTMAAGAQVLADGGGVSAPGYAFVADADTGCYLLTTGVQAWASGGAVKMALYSTQLRFYSTAIGDSGNVNNCPTDLYLRTNGGVYIGGTLLLGPNGFRPPSLADASAPNNCVYYSTTASKLAYKDGSGTVNNLY